jgi:hypothetical protein
MILAEGFDVDPNDGARQGPAQRDASPRRSPRGMTLAHFSVAGALPRGCSEVFEALMEVSFRGLGDRLAVDVAQPPG